MMKHSPYLNRRSFMGAGLCAALPLQAAFAAGRELRIVTRVLDVKGKAATVYGIDGWRTLDLSYGQPFATTVRNDIAEDSLLHWHGLNPPPAMDGVPMLSGPALAPGETRAFTFPLSRSGTHWMHSHVGLQEQRLLAAPMIVKETGEPLVDEQEHVVLLHDFTFRDPSEILAELKGGGGGHAAHSMSGKAGHDMEGGAVTMNDVTFDAMLANDRTLDDPEIVKAEKSGRFRLRIINGAAASNVWIDLGDIEGELIAVDGNAVYPVKGKRFPLAVAQRADIRLALPNGNGAWPIVFQCEGSPLRGGVILQSGNGQVGKLSDRGEPGAALDLALETQLVSVAEIKDEPVTRTEMVMLTGGGAGYVWGLNDKSGMHDVVFSVREGERINVMMHNMTSMAHPMHLHGHYFKVVAIGNRTIKGALRDTVLVPAQESVTIQFDADNPGTWAFHCHHLYHMNSGMMGSIAYSRAA